MAGAGRRCLLDVPALRSALLPRTDPDKIKSHRFRDYAMRFLFGAGIALVAALVGMKFGPKAGGVLLGFPAILPASLTLIQKREGKNEASIDSIGAILGATALILFAIVVAVAATSWGVLPGLLTALIVWLVVAVGLYVAIALIYQREFSAP